MTISPTDLGPSSAVHYALEAGEWLPGYTAYSITRAASLVAGEAMASAGEDLAT